MTIKELYEQATAKGLEDNVIEIPTMNSWRHLHFADIVTGKEGLLIVSPPTRSIFVVLYYVEGGDGNTYTFGTYSNFDRAKHAIEIWEKEHLREETITYIAEEYELNGKFKRYTEL